MGRNLKCIISYIILITFIIINCIWVCNIQNEAGAAAVVVFGIVIPSFAIFILEYDRRCKY